MASFVVAKWLATKDFPSGMLPEAGEERAFVQSLVYTVIRRLRPLRKVLGELVRTWPKGDLEALLYVGAAQILYMPDVPDFAAVNETVEAAKASANPSVAKVVNGVLRNLIRRREAFDAWLAALPPEERESFPTRLYSRWIARFGAEGAERLARWHNQPAETFLAWGPAAAEPFSFSRLPRGQRVTDVEGYADGRFVVQDPGTALAVELLAVKPGERILDACAAPGGKTVQIAWRGAKVVACEVNPARRRRLEENLARLRIAATVVPSLDFAEGETFDKVLADAPCSNTGVLRRRPDARWNWGEEKLRQLVAVQAEILDRLAGLVAPGGRLVYSTCSNEREENSAQVEAFLDRHPEFRLVASRESIPYETDTDGAFAAAVERVS